MEAVLLLRHAQSTWNAEGRWQGQADPPLSDFGQAQILLASSRLSSEEPFDLVVSSDLARARHTADLLAVTLRLAVPHTLEPGLREYDVGAWSGLTRDEIERRWPGELSKFDRGEVVAPPGGENRSAFDSRVRTAASAVADLARAEGAHRLLVVAHGGVLRSLARSVGLPDRRTGPLAGYRGDWDEGFLCPREPVDLLDTGLATPSEATPAQPVIL